MGIATAASPLAKGTTSRLVQITRTTANPVSGTSRNSAYVGCDSAIASDAAATGIANSQRRSRISRNRDASTIGTSILARPERGDDLFGHFDPRCIHAFGLMHGGLEFRHATLPVRRHSQRMLPN